MTLPPAVELQTALASTRKISDKRLLGKLERGGKAAEEALLAGQELLTFRLPMRRTDLRAATAPVAARLRQLKMALK